jgi:hypothetical protein
MAGGTHSFGAGNRDVYVIRTNGSGDTLWTRAFGGSGIDCGNSVVPVADGGCLVAAWTMSFGSGPSDMYVIRLDPAGETLWTRVYGGSQYDYAHPACQCRDGSFIIAGWTNSFGAGSYDMYVVKVNPSGDTVWTRTYGGTQEDYALGVAATADSGCVIAGFSSSFGVGGYDVYLVRIDASGDTLWTRTYGSSSSDWGYSIAPTTDGGYISAAGRAGSSQAWLLKTDAFGDTSWTRTFGGSGQEEGLAVAQTTDGGYVMSGFTTSLGAGGQDYYLVKTDPEGSTAVADSRKREARRTTSGTLVVRGVFRLADTGPHAGRHAALLDVAGRLAIGLRPGANDLGGLRAGVYYVVGAEEGAPARIVLLP